MRCLACLAGVVVTSFLTLGCGDFKKAMESDTKRAPVTLPGMAPIDQAGGAPPPPVTSAAPTPPAAPPADPAQAAPPVAGNTPAPPPDKTGIIGKTTAKVVDKKAAMAANPELVEVPNSLQGGDPISLAASAYFTIRGRASTLGLQNELKTFKALNERNPTYDELVGMMKTHGVEFAMLPRYQTYGYDAQAGTIVVLEDKAEKARLYKEAGVPLE